MNKAAFYTMVTMLALGILTAFWVARSLADFDLSEHNLKHVSFEFEGDILSGTLVMPKDVIDPPVVLIVHGDGAQTRFADGGYLPIINALVDAGIGVFSWDKAGVGASTGNWLHQTMDDRANEAIAALQAISVQESMNSNRIGFLGFSQAGWVLPRVANQTTPAFTVIIGGAVSWRDQGTYYNRVNMVLGGMSEAVIEQRLADRLRRNDAIFGATADPSLIPDMDAERFWFVAGAYSEDSSEMIPTMKGPILAMWGEQDLNVDARSNAEIYSNLLMPLTDTRRVMPLTDTRRVIVVPNATHGLLRADIYNYQLSSDWPWYLQYIYLGMGRKAFAGHTFDQIADWILTATEI